MTDPIALLRKLGELHRCAVRPHPEADEETFEVQCPACDGNAWQIWRRGDPMPGCEYWREYSAFWHKDADEVQFSTDSATATAPIQVGFVLDEDRAEFAADAERRVVSGLVIPWNAVAYSGGAYWMFAPGSLHWVA